MIDLKEAYLQNSSNIGRLFAYSLPNAYKVITMHDFVENRHHMIPTNSLLLPGVLFTGENMVYFSNNYHYESSGPESGILYDKGAEFEVGLASWMPREDRDLLEKSLSIEDPVGLYNHKTDSLCIARFSKNQYLNPDTDAEDLFDFLPSTA